MSESMVIVVGDEALAREKFAAIMGDAAIIERAFETQSNQTYLMLRDVDPAKMRQRILNWPMGYDSGDLYTATWSSD